MLWNTSLSTHSCRLVCHSHVDTHNHIECEMRVMQMNDASPLEFKTFDYVLYDQVIYLMSLCANNLTCYISVNNLSSSGCKDPWRVGFGSK